MLVALLCVAPLAPVRAESSGSPTIDLYVDGETGQVFTQPGKNRTKLGTFQRVDEPSARKKTKAATKPAAEPKPVAEGPASEAKPAVAETAPAPKAADHVGVGIGDFTAAYDKGFVIKPRDPKKTPFELRVNGRMQLRHVLFARDTKEYSTRTETVDVHNRNDFEIERGRLEFRGYALDPRAQFYLNLDMDTDDQHDVIAHDYWVNFAFDRRFDLYGGKGMVPGSRDWLNGSTRTRFADRSLATTFFRPDRTIGLWAKGEIVPHVSYHMLVGNGFNTSDLRPDSIDNQFAYATSLWWDVDGHYGRGASDLEGHETPGALVGTSFTFAPQQGHDARGVPRGEENFLRLSDGTRITEEGALGDGVTVDQFNVYLWALDAAMKWRGFSLNGEYFLRWVGSINGNGPLSRRDFFDHGFFVETGYFVIPKYVELNARTSQIFGAFGDRTEYAGGINWFVQGTHEWKLTFDGTVLDGSPASNTGTNYRVGDKGVLLRTQLQWAF